MTNQPTVCIPNIGKKGRNQRLMIGLLGVAAGLIVAVLLISTGAPTWSRVFTFLPFMFGALGIWQYLDKT